MEYTIENRKSYLYVKVSGQISLMNPYDWGKIKSARASVVASIKKTNINKLLIDGRDVSAKVTMIDRFLIAKFFVEENLKLIAGQSRLLKIAFIGNRSLLDPGKFGETVARNRGLNGFVTDNMQEALNWLEVDVPLEKKS